MTEDAPSSDSSEKSRPARAFHVVGVGASAGGFEAITTLLKNVTLDGLSLVVVQHLAPQHESALPSLFARSTPLTVVAITDGMKVLPNHVYVAPPNVRVALLHGTLHLLDATSGLGIDFFFRSLAEDLGSQAIGILLSGMGTDGTFGLKAIKEHGGIALVQDPKSAKYDSMPRSAIDAGTADRVLEPGALGAELMAIVRHPYLAKQTTRYAPDRERMTKLYILLRDAFGHDLTYYKQSTIERRLERRMALQKIDKLDDYLQLVQSSSEELASLYRDILINVTSFFRDPAVFDALATDTLPRLIARKRRGDPIRIWVPACASGEEAYSIAILLLEALGPRAAEFRIQIFGTDVDADAIAHARRGLYPTNIELDVSQERLERFFVKAERSFIVNRRVRDLVVFSSQNVAKDAPFSRIDLVSCRNMLIYFQAPLQKRVLRIFHYALVPEGNLLLGTSESVGDSADLFTLVDRKHKLYVKKTAATASPLLFGMQATPEDEARDAELAVAGLPRPAMSPQQLADRRILDRYAPPSVLVNENLDVIQFRGDTGPYLSPTSGAATLNALRLVRPELHVDLRRLIQRAMAGDLTVQRANVRVDEKGNAGHTIGIEVTPLELPGAAGRCLLVVFHENAGAMAEETPPEPPAEPEERMRYLQHELEATKEFLQSTIEELESSNEELKSTNEELQSSNEELQSTNEELETSKEELQSSNEELVTVNDELQHRMTDLAHRGNDLSNLLRTVREAIVFVSTNGTMTRFSSAAQRLFALVPTDAGRQLEQLRVFFPGADLQRLMMSAVERVGPVDEEVEARDGRWFTVTAQPYSGPDGSIDGVLLRFDDLGANKRR